MVRSISMTFLRVRFLLITLQVKYVLEPKDSGEKRRRLSSLPQSPTDAYHGVIDRMTPDDIQFARRILGWVLHAQRILTMPELQEALAIEIGVASLNQQDITGAEEIISTCGGFVDHNQDSDLVTFSHETVRPFLEEHEFKSLPSHSVLCKTCLTYLQLPPFEKPCKRQDSDQRQVEFKLGNYAATFWANHAVQCEREFELETTILETFRSDGRREAMEQLSDHYYTQRKSLLHVLIEARLTFIFASPLSNDEAVARMHVSILNWANSKFSKSNCGKEHQRQGRVRSSAPALRSQGRRFAGC